MATIPDDLRYTREHEWGRLDDGGRITVGITDFAQEQLGDVVYLELPAVGATVTGGEPMGEIESTKSVSDIYAPVSGAVVEVNVDCRDNPAAINQDPYGEGWMVVIDPADLIEYDSMLGPEEYEEFIAQQVGDVE